MSKFELVYGHTKSSFRLGTPLGSYVEKIWIVASVGLVISAGLRALPAKEKREVPRQPPRPQVPYEVGRILIVMVYPLFTKGTNSSISHNIRI